MADPIPISEPHLRIQPKPIKKSKSCSDFILKFLFLSLLFIVLPLFPSQAPEFFSQKTLILTKLWELLHLLFIGIVVAYGLFSTRNCELESNLESQSSNNNNNAPSYVSKFFPASTIFGDESENSNGFDENKMMHCWNNNQYFDGSNEGNCSGSTVGVFDEQYNNTQLPNSDENFGYSVRFDNDNDGNLNGTNVVQAWNSEYCYSEPVVVAQPYYGCGEFGEVVGYKPLGLPVRSLKLVEREVDGCEYVEGSDSSLGSRSSLKRLDVSEVREFEDLVPSNLEKKFNDVANVGGGGMVSSVQWNSRFRRMEREKVYGNVTGSSQFRPVLVDEMNKFEGVGLRSSQSTASFSLPASMHSSFDSIASDNVYMDFQVDEMRQKEASYVPDASEKTNFLDKEMRRRKNSYVPALENVIFREEDTEQRMMNSYVAAVEDTNFQRRDLGKKVSLRNRRMGSKGKHVDFTYPANFRPLSVDETQFESRNSESFESAGSFPSNMRMYAALDSVSSDTIDFQEEDMRQKETFPVHTSENMNFEEENVHALENVNFQEEDLGQKNNSFVHVSEDMNFQEVDLVKKISQVSRNEMMETIGKYAAVSRPSHLRPLSVDETQLELHSSRSLQSRGSFSSQTSLRSSVDSISSENMNSLQEAIGEKKSLHGSSSSSSSSSPSQSARRNGETSLQAFEGRGYNIDSLLKDDLNNSLNNDDWRDKSGIGGEDDHLGNKESTMHGLHSDSDRPISLAKALSKGKSVRTRRANGMTSGTMKIDEASSKQADEKIVKKPNNVDNVVMRKDKIKSREPDLLLKGISKKTLDCYFPKQEATFSSHRKRDKPEPSKNVTSEDSDIKLENNVQGSSDEDVVSEYVNDSGLDSEVDKKASEFIAKFKAQIRLQKTGSIERSKGQKIFGDNVR